MDLRIFASLKRLSYKVNQLISYSFAKTTNDFSLLWFISLNKLTCALPHLPRVQVSFF